MNPAVALALHVGTSWAADPPSECTPKWYRAVGRPLQLAPRFDGPAFHLSWVGESVAMCAVDTNFQTYGGVLACWTIDTGSGALTPRRAEGLPGLGVRRPMKDHCVDGYCVQPTYADTALVARSAGGGLVAVAVEGAAGNDQLLFYLFDAATHQRVRTFAAWPPWVAAVHRWPEQLYFVGDALYVVSSDGNLGRVAFRMRADGAPLEVWEEAGVDGPVPVSSLGGNIVALDPGHAGFVSGGLGAVRSFPTAGGEATTRVRALPEHTCTHADIAAFGAWTQDAACSRFIETHLQPYWGISLVSLDGGGYLGVANGQLIWFDPALTETRRAPLAICAD